MGLLSGFETLQESAHSGSKRNIGKSVRYTFHSKTRYELLNRLLKRIYKNKTELLLVLDRPEIPLLPLVCKGDIRDYVKKKKVSGGTRSATGRRCRDTFASLKKTCRKQGVSFWHYLQDRLSGAGTILPLPELIRQSVAAE